MGMVLELVTLGDSNIQRLLADPPLIWRLIAPEDPGLYEEMRRKETRPSFLARLFGKKSGAASAALPDLMLSDGEGRTADLDKAWHGIHYLLTGTALEGQHPWNFLATGGTEIGDIEVGYGPARVFTFVETCQIKQALDGISDEELRERFRPEDMTAQQIYPEIWKGNPEEDDTLTYLMGHVQILRSFVQEAVEEGTGFVIYLS